MTQEEARKTRLNSIKRELIRDNLMPYGGIPNVPYYETVEEQNQFLQSISNTEFGRQFENWQGRYTAQGVPLILPKFNDVENISLNEQLFLAMQSIGLEKYQDGTYRVDGGKKQSILFKQLALTKGKIGGYYQFVEPSEYYISIGAVPENLLKAKHGTDFKRGQAYQPVVTEKVTVEAPQEITLDSIVSGITQAVTVQEAAAEPLASTILPAPTLSQEIRKIIDDWSTKKIIVPNWFANNNINWVLQGKISEEEFLAGYTNLLNTGVITTPPTPTPPTPTPPTPTPPTIDTSTSLTMISQKWDYFDIVDGRAKGQITFRATSDFNPYYYGKELVNYMQLVNNQGLTIVLKPNVLRFTQTEQDETIQYDEGVGDLKSVKVESYVWTHDNQPMSSLYKFPIYDGKPPGTGTGELARSDFLAKIGGVLAGSIAIALLLPKRIGK